MENNVDGIVLSVTRSKESDAVLSVLTENGKIPVFVKGIAKSKKNRLFAQPFSYSEFELRQGKGGMYICSGARLKDAFYGVRESLDALAAGQYFLEATQLIDENNREAEVYMKLLLNSLYLLSSKREDIDVKKIKVVFEIKFAYISGLFPENETCVSCGEDISFWSFEEGFLCRECAEGHSHKNCFELSPAIRSAIFHILKSDGIRAYKFTMNDEAFERLAALTEKYLQYKTEVRFRSLDFSLDFFKE